MVDTVTTKGITVSAATVARQGYWRGVFRRLLRDPGGVFVGAIILILLAVALGVPPKRSTSALGVFLSIVLIVAYFKVNQYAASVGERGEVDPLIALWVPFAVFATLVLWMYHTLAHVPGGQPIGALERVAGKAAKFVARYLPGRRREPVAAETTA